MSVSADKTSEFRNLVFRSVLCGNYNPGDRLPTEREMAELHHISRITVRRAYDELALHGILDRRQGSGTYVGSSRGANRDAGNLTALLISVNDEFTLDFIRTLEHELAATGQLLVLKLTDESPDLEENAAIDLVANGVKNLIVWPSGEHFRRRTFARLRVLGVNMVFFDRMMPGDYADFVGLDNLDAVRKLFDRAGNIKCAVFAGHAGVRLDSDQAREEAFLRECARRNIEGLVRYFPRFGELAQAPDFTKADAVFAVNDNMGVKLLPFANGIPVYGIDGLSKKIVSYRQPMAKFAAAVVKRLQIQRQKGENWQAETLLLKGEICEPSK